MTTPTTPEVSQVEPLIITDGPSTASTAPSTVAAMNSEPATPDMQPDAIVSVKNLVKKYGDFTAVADISFDVHHGAIFGLIGPNGAGKSTTFSVIASLLLPTSGSATVAGFSTTEQSSEVRKLIGYMPDQLGVYGTLTAEQYLRFFAAAYQIPKADWPGLVDGLLELVGLEGKRKTIVDTMSRGMKQRMSLARALVHDPQLLILDEPASGLDPRARVELRELIQQLAAMDKTIIISSHILSELEEMCTDVAIIEGGRVLISGKPSEIATSLGARNVIVRFTDGTSAEYPVTGDEQQVALLKHLVLNDPRDVLSYQPGGEGLEDLFMRLTEGGVR